MADLLHPNRRTMMATLCAGLGTFALNGASRAASAPTAREIVARIQAQCAREGIAWRKDTVDTFKAGNPDIPVTGIVTTFMSTLATIQRAHAAGANFVISHEPTWWDHFDDPGDLKGDPTYLAKRRFVEANGMVIWRFHDHWHAVKPEPMSTASLQRLGWQPWQMAGEGFSRMFALPPQSLGRLIDTMSVTLPSHSIRAVGDANMAVRKIAMVGHELRGIAPRIDDADVFIGPEVIEIDTVEFFRDLAEQGRKKALIMLAHERGEEGGMDRCDEWLRGFVTEVPVNFISSGEPFRNLTT